MSPEGLNLFAIKIINIHIVEIDTTIRKNVFHSPGVFWNIPDGEELNIEQIIQKTKGSLAKNN